MENSNDIQNTTNIGNEVLADVMPSCLDCYYSGNGKHSCDRHMNKLKPDYSKGVECYYNNYAHYRAFRHEE